MQRYQIKMFGATPLLLHNDNLAFGEKVTSWQKDPANASMSVKGDDRSPAWTWIGYLYHDNKYLGIDADNIMSMLGQAGAKMPIKGKETYRKRLNAGVMLDQQQFKLTIDGHPIPWGAIKDLRGDNDFAKHIDSVEALGFELLIKRAVIGRGRNVRVRPMFRAWEATGSLTVMDEETSGVTHDALVRAFEVAGAIIGIGDWRPSSPKSGTFGKFTSEVIPL